MSRLTRQMLSSIDYVSVRERRVANFNCLHKYLSGRNEMSLAIELGVVSGTFVPFCYPFKTQKADVLRTRLIENKIYVPTYWPELRNSPDLNHAEQSFVKDIICLPIDQRCDEADMMRIIEHLKGL